MTTVRETISAALAGVVRYEPALDALTVAPATEVDAAIIEILHDALATLWRRGWQPVELHRVVGRRGHAKHAHLLKDAIAAYMAGFAPAAVDERWQAQLDELRAYAPQDYLREFGRSGRLERVEVVDTALTLLAILSELPPIELLVPPPGTARRSRARASGAVHRGGTRLLDRVRGLLAKAESTDYPAEAEAYTAKAQELITRYSLDEALLEARAGDAVVPLARRIGVDHPYEAEKAALLDAVAAANRCYAVWSPELGFATVFGFDADIDAVEVLHTSSWCRRTTRWPGASRRAARRAARGCGRTGSRSWWRSRCASASGSPPPPGPPWPRLCAASGRPTCCRCWRPATSRSASPCARSSPHHPGPGHPRRQRRGLGVRPGRRRPGRPARTRPALGSAVMSQGNAGRQPMTRTGSPRHWASGSTPRRSPTGTPTRSPACWWTRWSSGAARGTGGSTAGRPASCRCPPRTLTGSRWSTSASPGRAPRRSSSRWTAPTASARSTSWSPRRGPAGSRCGSAGGAARSARRHRPYAWSPAWSPAVGTRPPGAGCTRPGPIDCPRPSTATWTSTPPNRPTCSAANSDELSRPRNDRFPRLGLPERLPAHGTES
ncbi:DUF2786 domain-containing protein [Luedemannella flava]